MALDAAKLRYALITANGATETEIVAAVAGKRIVVHNYVVVMGDVLGTITFKAGGPPVSGNIYLLAGSGVSAPGGIDNRWFETGIGLNLTINNSSTSVVSGHLAYTLE